MNVTGYKSEYFQNHILKAAVECAMCNGTGKITEKQFGGKNVAEQSRAGWSPELELVVTFGTRHKCGGQRRYGDIRPVTRQNE